MIVELSTLFLLFFLIQSIGSIINPADTDVFKTSSGRLRKVTTSYDQTRRRHDDWNRRRIYDVLKMSDLRCLEDVQFGTSWKRLIYNVFRTSDLRRHKDRRFTSSWRDVQFTTSWRHLIHCVATSQRHLYNVERNNFFLFCTVWNIQKILTFPV